MGLPLRDPTSFSSFTSGPTSPGGLSLPAETDLDLDASETPCHRNRKLSRHLYRHAGKHTHQACRGNTCRLGQEAQCSRFRQRKTHRTSRARQHNLLQTYSIPPVAETHHVKPHNPWTADTTEGCALARSLIKLPGEEPPAAEPRHNPRSRSRSDSQSSSSSTSRPPSLERQNAFRDEKTTKQRQRRHRQARSTSTYYCPLPRNPTAHDAFLADRVEDTDFDEEREIEELYRLGLLYDDEHERGEGFSLERIRVEREEPVYSLRVARPAPARGRGRGSRVVRGVGNGFRDVDFLDGVDLAFSAFGRDEALAGWLLSPGGSGLLSPRTAMGKYEARPGTEAAHDTPRLMVIYELADDAVSAVSAGDFLDDVSVSDISYCGWGDDDEAAWAALNGGGEAVLATEADGDEVDPWVVLGRDGS